MPKNFRVVCPKGLNPESLKVPREGGGLSPVEDAGLASGGSQHAAVAWSGRRSEEADPALPGKKAPALRALPHEAALLDQSTAGTTLAAPLNELHAAHQT